MPNWIAITLAQLEAASLLGIVDTMRDEARDRGLADPWTTLTPQITDELRACIGFSGRYQLDTDTTKIPRGLLPLALKKIVREMSRSLGRSLSDDEKSDEKTYEARLDLIRTGQWPVEAPDTPGDSNTVPGAPGLFGSDTQIQL
ncbi:MAG: hypothetical protein KGL39_48400 [Patescibacteria group bacterium]|nr:hypothetical protein [Patescibacteria group bacterium]